MLGMEPLMGGEYNADDVYSSSNSTTSTTYVISSENIWIEDPNIYYTSVENGVTSL